MFEIRPSPGKGQGLFATRAIRRGERLIRESPLISLSPQEDTRTHWWRFLYMKFESLSPEDQAKYLELSYLPNKFPDHVNRISFFLSADQGVKDEDVKAKADFLIKIMSIYAVNNAEINDDGDSGSGIFPTFTRINHSCVPNTVWAYQPSTQEVEVCANRNIAVDEEITVSYVITLAPSSVRAAEIEHYGFECRCEACDGPGKDVSNQRRQRISELDNMFRVYECKLQQDDSSPPVEFPGLNNVTASRLASEYINLLIAERLLGGELVRAYNLSNRYHLLIGDHERAARAAEMASVYRVMPTLDEYE
ncbi:hypothetical protein F4818DRAFT_457410 [Hypoxylon cercidicola]|nr:hypothetical protein F4818DRAFT_457410 [Hypoxylon cercidicola]